MAGVAVVVVVVGPAAASEESLEVQPSVATAASRASHQAATVSATARPQRSVLSATCRVCVQSARWVTTWSPPIATWTG